VDGIEVPIINLSYIWLNVIKMFYTPGDFLNVHSSDRNRTVDKDKNEDNNESLSNKLDQLDFNQEHADPNLNILEMLNQNQEFIQQSNLNLGLFGNILNLILLLVIEMLFFDEISDRDEIATMITNILTNNKSIERASENEKGTEKKTEQDKGTENRTMVLNLLKLSKYQLFNTFDLNELFVALISNKSHSIEGYL